MKTCSKCKIEKEFSEFHKSKSEKSGYYSCCKSCKKAYRDRPEVKAQKALKEKEYFSIPENKEHRERYIKEYYSDPKNRERRSIKNKEYVSRPEIKEKTSLRIKKHRSKPEVKESRKNYLAEYYSNQENKDRKRLKSKEYTSRPEIKEKRNIRNKEYQSDPEVKKRAHNKHQERLATDIQYRIKCNLRCRFKNALKGNYKSGSAVSDLGCSIEDFKKYIEYKFLPGMSWDNWGKYSWHIDHIIPLSSFDLTNREQFLKAVHYTNLQPLWAKDNLSKSDKILPKP